MKKSLLYIFLLLILPSGLFAQVTVTGSTGANGAYTTLALAFSAINGSVQTGNNIVITLTASTNETSSAVLNTGTWTSVTIYPTVTGITISGNLSSPLIDLNGADNVTIDGRVNATGTLKDMTIVNTSTGATAGISTIRFINDATINTIKYCILKGSETSTTSGALFFSSTNGTTGNSGNIITNNDITCSSDANRPVNAVFSVGTAAKNNSGNNITNNNIYDFLNRSLSSNAINLSTNNTDWIITGNSFYETAPFIPASSVAYYVIYINNNGGNFLVSDNFIGGRTSSAGGMPWIKTNAFNNIFNGIYLYAGTGSSNNIQNNTINNINWSNSLNGTWTGIYIGRGDVNVGTVTGNVIGAETGTDSILVTCSTTGNNVYGINIASPGTVNCLNNRIGSITIANIDANGCNFYGINKTYSSGTTIIINNIIGSAATNNSIFASSASTGNVQTVRGIYCLGTGNITISGNTIANLNNNTTNATSNELGKINGIYSSSGINIISNNIIHDLTIRNGNSLLNINASVCGIALNSPTLKTVTGNQIFNLSNSYSGFAGGVIGLYFTGNSEGNIITNNFIHGLSVNSSSPGSSIYGIKINSGSSIYSNNIIALGGNEPATIYGIYEYGTVGNNNNIYFNTVSICGNPSSGVNKSYALYSTSINNTRDFRNNILVNARSTAGSSGLHYALYIIVVGGNITCNYNDYWVPGIGGILGYYGGNKLTLPIVSGQDAASISADPLFATSCGTSATDYIPSAQTIIAQAGIGVITDYDGNPRDPNYPSMGAYEIAIPLNIEVYKTNLLQARYVRLKDAFDAFNSGVHNTGDFEIRINGNVNENKSAVLDASGTGSANYSSIKIYPTLTGITISGNLAAPLIDLNGADNTTFDGRVNATGAPNAMTIINSSIADTSVNSAIRMINGATNNAVRYCTLKGSAPATGSGVILFSTSAGPTGNIGNIVEFNDITGSDDVNRPLNAIYSAGSSGFANSSDTISSNNIYNFLNPSLSSSGIYLFSNSTDWIISGNSLYETGSFAPAASTSYYMLRINNTGGNYSINGNYIGGSSPLCGGTAWTKTNEYNNAFYGIYLYAGTGTTNNIQSNTIRNFDLSNSLNGSWTGIYAGRGDANIGTVTGNIIGSLSVSGSILLTSKTNGTNVYGVNIGSPGTVSCLNNQIGSFTIANADANGVNFYGINKSSSAGITTISNNTIGSTTIANSIIATSHSTGNAQALRGIYSAGTGAITISNNTIANIANSTTNANVATRGKVNGIFSSSGTNTISGNTIHDLTIANANNISDLNAAVCGISTSGPTVKNITSNTIYNLSNTNAAFTGSVIGLYFTGSSAGNSISKNFIHSLSVSPSSSAASIYGIKMNTGTGTYVNNIIALSPGTPTTVYGIYESGSSGSTNNLYFNTISLCGSPASGSNKSYALYSAIINNTRNFENNILSNTRSTAGGSSLHYALYIVAAGGTITSDYNDYWVSGSGGMTGYFGGDKPALPIVTGQDAASLAIDPVFSVACGTSAADYFPSVELPGLTISGITTDFGDNPRIIPTMGAWEGFMATWKGAVSTDWNTAANWLSNRVPGPDANIVFDPAPLNNAVMDQDRSVRKVTNSTAYTIVANGHKLTIKGKLFFSSGPKIDASAMNSTAEILSDSIHTIENLQFLNSDAYNVIIGNTTGVTLNSDFNIDNSLTINSGTSLTINAPHTLTVSGTLTNTAGIAGLVIKSTANGIDGKLVNNSPGINATVELALSGGVSPTGNSIHFFVPPVQSMVIGATIADVNTNLGTTNFAGDLVSYDETKTLLARSKGWQYFDGFDNTTPFPNNAITSAMGYSFYLTQDDKITFKGVLNGSTHTFNLNFTAGAHDPGGNLIGNPYPCNYDLTAIPELMGPQTDNVENTVYIYRDGVYRVYNVSTGVGDIGYTSIVPPMQGFFINITGPASLTFPTDGKTAKDAGVARSKALSLSEKGSIRKFKLVLENEASYDETTVCLINDATTAFDGDYDAHKLFGSNTTVPIIYSELNNVKYAINSLQAPDSGAIVIPLKLELKTAGSYKITVPEFDNMDGIKVVLKHGTIETDLKMGSAYSFKSEAGTLSDYELIIGDAGKTISSEKPVLSRFNTWYNNGYLFIKCPEDIQAAKGKLIIYDSQGKSVTNNNLIYIEPGQTLQIPVSLTRGLYIINVLIGNQPSTSKIVVF